MSDVVVFLGQETLPWLELDEGRVIRRGDDPLEPGTVATAVAPASCLTYRTASFGGLSPAQALAAAKLDAADASLCTDRHVAVAVTGDRYVITDRSTMEHWLAQLAEHEIVPSAIVPAPDLLPVPEDGFVKGVVFGEQILRSAHTGLEDDGVISALVVGDAPVQTLEQDQLEAALAEAIAAPQLNLLQGDFAPRADWRAPAGYWRRIVVFLIAIVGITLAIPIAQWVRLSLATSSMNEQSATISALVLGERSGSEDAVDRLQDKVAELRGGGAGFLPTLAALMSAVETMPNVELAQLSFDPDGTMRATVRASSQPEIDMLVRAMEGRSFTVTKDASRSEQGRMSVEVQVRPK